MRGALWLLGAGALLGAGGLLMTQGDAGSAAHKVRDNLAFPTHAQAQDVEREAARRTFAATLPSAPASTADEPLPKRDPLFVVFPPEATTALVFEAGTVLHAPVGQAMLECVSAHEREHMDKGIDADGRSWLDLADRVAFASTPAGELFAVQGKLGAVDMAKLAPDAEAHAYSASTTMYEVGASEHRGKFHAALWNGSLLVASSSRQLVEAAVDRLDAGGAASKPPFDEREAYGEIYGIVGQADLERMVPEDLRARVHEVAAHGEVHVDAIDEVLLVMDVEGSDAKQVEDLGKSLGAALAVGRLEAKREGEDELVRLMDQSRVRPYGNRRLRAEVAVPTELMTRSMRGCSK